MKEEQGNSGGDMEREFAGGCVVGEHRGGDNEGESEQQGEAGSDGSIRCLHHLLCSFALL